MRQQILVSGEWVEGVPVIGEWYKQEVALDVWQEQRCVEIIAPTPLIPIIITGITGSLYHAADFSKAACNQLASITVTGTVAIPDRFFAMPVKTAGSGEIVFFGAQVTDGVFSVVINFEKSGQYKYTDDEANLDLPAKTFTVLPMTFDVLRVTA